MRLFVLTAVYLLFSGFISGQSLLTGKVTDQIGKPIAGAMVRVLNTSQQTLSDSLGSFSLRLPDTDTGRCLLLFTHEACVSDTVDVHGKQEVKIRLQTLQTITGARVTGSGGPQSAYIGHQTIKTEVITENELKKAACCDLAGCFETQGTVQPMTTNILTNSKELRILGLSGIYNQVLIDGMPLIQGLSFTYGISSIPGTLVDNIYVAKGTTSVLQGFESMVGQINVIPKSPPKGDKLLLNFYINSFGENHYNTNYQFGKGKWSNLVSAHMVRPAQKWDRDRDGFLDLPKLTRYMVYNKLKYGDDSKKGLNSSIGIRYLWEQRIGGQVAFNPMNDLGSTQVYGQKVQYQQPELYTKTAYRIRSDKKITLLASGFRQNQSSWLGTVQYKARQENAYANLQYELSWRKKHEFKTGASYRYMLLNEEIGFSDTALKRTYNGQYIKREAIPGVFAENTFSWKGDIITLITGIRADHHTQFGWQITPRAMFKYDVTDKAIIRASAGKGWRTVNLFSENIGLLVSSRDLIFKEVLNPEKAFNWGVNLLQKFTRKHLSGYLTMDFYQTRFQNQFFPDYDTDPSKAYIANFSGTSVSNGFQADLNVKFYKLIEAKIAYNFLDVYRMVDNSKIQLPFNARHKILASVSYAPKSKKWRADLNAHWFGKQRLPDTRLNPEAFRQMGYSKPYTTINVQISKTWKKLELYGGCENLFDFRQLRPIVSWQNPFSPYFDTSFNWGPSRGRELYIGVKYKPFAK